MDFDAILSNSDLDFEINDGNNSNKENNSESISLAPIIKIPRIKNPIEEHLNIQLNCIQNQIDQINCNIDLIKNVSENTLKNVAARAVFKEDSSSESDDDLYASNGEPILKKIKKSRYEKTKVLIVHRIWQKLVDDKWIVGVELESTTNCVLKEPTIYVYQKNGNNTFSGTSAFWSLVENKFWFPTEEIDSKERVIATVVLDLPTFDSKLQIEAYGIIFCEYNEKLFQTPLPKIHLTVEDAISKDFKINFDEKADAEISLLALKVISIDRFILIPASGNPLALRIMEFLSKYNFEEICNVCILRNFGSLQHCILEILPVEDGDLQVCISARSEAQLSAVTQLIKKSFPELLDPEKQQIVDDAAEALLEELSFYLTSNSSAKIQRAKIKSDLLII